MTELAFVLHDTYETFTAENDKRQRRLSKNRLKSGHNELSTDKRSD